MILTLRHLFTPHYTNNHRPRILHPAGLTVVIGVYLLAQSLLQLAKYTPALPGGMVLGYASNIAAGDVITQTNAKRAELGLPPLKTNGALSQAAAAKAAHMFQHDYWAHIAPDGTTPWVFMRQAGYGYTVAGENLARDFGDTPSMMDAWMASPTHKDNIVNGKYSEIGVAVVDGKLQGVETTLVVQMFGNPAGTPQIASGQNSSTGIKPKTKVITQPSVAPSVPAVAPTSPVEAPAMHQPKPETLGNLAGLESSTRITVSSQPDKPRLSPLLLSKAVSGSIIILMTLVLLYDAWVLYQKKLHRNVGKNWAHLALLGILLAIVAAMSQGKVL